MAGTRCPTLATAEADITGDFIMGHRISSQGYPYAGMDNFKYMAGTCCPTLATANADITGDFIIGHLVGSQLYPYDEMDDFTHGLFGI